VLPPRHASKDGTGKEHEVEGNKESAPGKVNFFLRARENGGSTVRREALRRGGRAFGRSGNLRFDAARGRRSEIIEELAWAGMTQEKSRMAGPQGSRREEVA